jgi:transposase
MPRPFPVEFCRRAVPLVRAGKPITTAELELGISAAAIHNCVRQDQIDRGERPGITTPESIELAKAKKRIWQRRWPFALEQRHSTSRVWARFEVSG